MSVLQLLLRAGSSLAFLLPGFFGGIGQARAQPECPAKSNPVVESAWTAFRGGKLRVAERAFASALTVCADHPGGLTGLGYVRLRLDDDEAARSSFASALAVHPESVDALVGLGLIGWRLGDMDAVQRYFKRVLELDAANSTALEYLARMPSGVGPPPSRGELVLPDSLRMVARARAGQFEINDAGSWRPFYVKGVNLGAILPGREMSEFPDSTTYAQWMRQMSAMGVNAVRLYSVHPPHFYAALLAHNERAPQHAVHLVQGIGQERPREGDFLSPHYEDALLEQAQFAVDAVHGRANRSAAAGRAAAFYTANVSEWTLAYLIGSDWGISSVRSFIERYPEERGWEGDFVTVRSGNAMDAWLGKVVEYVVSYETKTYAAQRPVAYAIGPALDPLSHPTAAIGRDDPADDSDGVSLDARRVRATKAFPAGTFAAFNAYPFDPDFMMTDPGYRTAASSHGRSNYFGYLKDLKAHFGSMPVLIAEYGVPASLGITRLQNQGWHQGGLREAEVAEANRRMTLEIAEAGMAGGMLFAWIDEWFRQDRFVKDFELPAARSHRWYNRLDPGEHFGILAAEPVPAVSGAALQERLEAWQTIPPLYLGADSSALRVTSDEAYLWLLAEVPYREAEDTLMIGIDMVNPRAGDRRWPGGSGPQSPVGLEFVLVDGGGRIRLLVDPPQNPFRHSEASTGPSRTAVRIPIEQEPPGFFHSREQQLYNLPYYAQPNEDGVYEALRVLVNPRQVASDSSDYLAMGYDRSLLPRGPAPDGLWERTDDASILEVRIPWGLLNVTDPSGRRILQGPGAHGRSVGHGARGRSETTDDLPSMPTRLNGDLGTVVVEDIRIVAALRKQHERWRLWPHDGAAARYAWPRWNEPKWRVRSRPTYEAVHAAFETLEIDRDAEEIRTVSRTPAHGSDDTTVHTFDSTDVDALLQSGLDFGKSGRFEEAATVLGRAIRLEPKNVEARIALARVLAWKGDLEDALALLDKVLADNPDDSQALEARALFQSWAGRYSESLATYDRLLAVSPHDVSAQRGRATVLSWSSEFTEAREALERLVFENPYNLDLRLDLARILTYEGQLPEARAMYAEVLRRDPDNARAYEGLARARSFGGDLVGGELAYRTALALDAADVGTMVGLGQNLRWQGRSGAALRVLRRADDVSPGNADILEQLRWVEASLGPQIRPNLALERDSDENVMLTTSAALAYHPIPSVGLRVDTYHRTLENLSLRRQAQGFAVTASFQLDPGWALAAGVNGARNDGARGLETVGYQVSISTPSRNRAGLSVSLNQSALDATALLVERGVTVWALEGAVRWEPTTRWRMDASAGWAEFEGTRLNVRQSGMLSVSRTLGEQWTLGLGARAFGFEQDLLDGYFDPDFYGLAELTGRWLWQPGSWSLTLEGAPGLQQVYSRGKVHPSVRTATRLARHFGPGREIALGGTFASAGVQSFASGASDYRYLAAVLAIRWGF